MTLANKITLSRIFLVPAFIIFLLKYAPQQDYFLWWAFGLYLFGIVSDVFDGYVARKWNQETQLGAMLDPLADKALTISALLCLYFVGHAYQWNVRIPIWLVVALISREVLLIVGSVILQMIKGKFRVRANIWGKITAILHVAVIVGVFLQWSFSGKIFGIALIMSVASGIVYIKEGINSINGT